MLVAKTNDFCTIAEKSGIEIVPFRMSSVDSMSAEVDGQCYIAMDCSRHHTAAEEQACIGHELGHCLYGGFYTRNTPFDMIERHEVRADRWYILRAIPRRTLFRLLKEGYDAWEIAEQLNTTEEYVRRAYYYYKDNP